MHETLIVAAKMTRYGNWDVIAVNREKGHHTYGIFECELDELPKEIQSSGGRGKINIPFVAIGADGKRWEWNGEDWRITETRLGERR